MSFVNTPFCHNAFLSFSCVTACDKVLFCLFVFFVCLFVCLFFSGGGEGEGDVNTSLALTLFALTGRSKQRFPNDNHCVTIATVRYLDVLVLNRVR